MTNNYAHSVTLVEPLLAQLAKRIAKTNLGGSRFWRAKRSFNSELMHDPIGLSSFGCSSLVKHKGFSHAHQGPPPNYWPIFSGGFPITGYGCSICSWSSCILLIALAIKVPFFASNTSCFCQESSPHIIFPEIYPSIKNCIMWQQIDI